MYYSHPCPYCRKIFYTFQSNKESASEILFSGIKQHLIDYDEDRKEYEMDEGKSIEVNQMYRGMRESDSPPSGGYEL